MSKCLLFDSDGTLVESELLNNEALSAELALLHINEAPDSLVSRYRGWNLFEVLADLQARNNVELDEGFVGRFRARAEQHFTMYLQAVAGIEQALTQLNHPKCVVSNAPMAKLRHVLAITGLAAHFDNRLFSAYEVKSWKPSPDLFLHAAAEMGSDPLSCIVIEDSVVGVEAAVSAGMPTVLYDPTGSHGNSKATVIIDSMALLPDAIAGLG